MEILRKEDWLQQRLKCPSALCGRTAFSQTVIGKQEKKMEHLKIESEFIKILKEIKSQNRVLSKWREIESSDMFQSEKYCGGFDSIEDKFTFSYYADKKQEFWFEITLEEIDKILKGEINNLEVRKSD